MSDAVRVSAELRNHDLRFARAAAWALAMSLGPRPEPEDMGEPCECCGTSAPSEEWLARWEREDERIRELGVRILENDPDWPGVE